jgi:cell division transport system permease protein
MKRPRAKPKRSSGTDFGDKIKAYLQLHAQALFSSLGRLVRTPVTFSMTVAVLALAISLAGGFYLLLANIQQLTGDLEASNQISIFLKPEISVDDGQNLTDVLQNNPHITDVLFISKQQAMEEFKQYSGFGEALDALAGNPLPNVIQVLPKNTLSDDALFEKLTSKLEQLPEVDFVQVDMAWLKRLQAMLHLANRGIVILNSLLALAILFITGNTIRLELQNRKEEVLIAKLVGATDGFIRRPFLYSGFWYGFIAGLCAWILITIIVLLIQHPLEQLSELYDERFDVRYLNLKETFLMLLTSSGLGMLGAGLVLYRQIQQLKPD